MARVSRTSRDARYDYHIPRVRARQLYEEGKLFIDLTNSKPDAIRYDSQTREEAIKMVIGQRIV